MVGNTQLAASQQQDVLKYVQSMRGQRLSAPSGIEFVARLKNIHIPKEDLEGMKKAIEDCEKIAL